MSERWYTDPMFWGLAVVYAALGVAVLLTVVL